MTLEEKVNLAFAKVREARIRLKSMVSEDISNYTNSMLLARNKEAKGWADQQAEAEEEIERLKMVIQARMIDQHPKGKPG